MKNIKTLEQAKKDSKTSDNIELTTAGYSLYSELNKFFTDNKVTKETLDENSDKFDLFLKGLLLKELKKYSNSLYKQDNKELLNIYEITKGDYDYGVVINHIDKNNVYEVYLYIQYDKIVVSNLLEKIFDNKKDALKYYHSLIRLVKWSRFRRIQVKIIKNK